MLNLSIFNKKHFYSAVPENMLTRDYLYVSKVAILYLATTMKTRQIFDVEQWAAQLRSLFTLIATTI